MTTRTCIGVFKSGGRRGKTCGAKIKKSRGESKYCGLHAGYGTTEPKVDEVEEKEEPMPDNEEPMPELPADNEEPAVSQMEKPTLRVLTLWFQRDECILEVKYS